jgi:hypothetical protein
VDDSEHNTSEPPPPSAAGQSDRLLTQADAADVLMLAIEKLDETSEMLRGAVARLGRENDEARELARQLSVPPPAREPKPP